MYMYSFQFMCAECTCAYGKTAVSGPHMSFVTSYVNHPIHISLLIYDNSLDI
jgi:hypothetical protein